MTKQSFIAQPLLALAVALVITPLAAQEPTVVTGKHRPIYQERVSFADLDLRRGSGQRLLRSRVRRASSDVCFKAEGVDHDRLGVRGGLSCDDQTYQDARPQISAAIHRAKSGQTPAAIAIAISASRVR
jgi:UrcA family protein